MVRRQLENEKEIRYNRLYQIRKQLTQYGVLYYDPGEKFVAIGIPLVCKEKNIIKIQDKFMKYDYNIKKVKFDVNRDMLNPDYKNSLLLDIGSKNECFSNHLEIISKTL